MKRKKALAHSEKLASTSMDEIADLDRIVRLPRSTDYKPIGRPFPFSAVFIAHSRCRYKLIASKCLVVANLQ